MLIWVQKWDIELFFIKRKAISILGHIGNTEYIISYTTNFAINHITAICPVANILAYRYEACIVIFSIVYNHIYLQDYEIFHALIEMIFNTRS